MAAAVASTSRQVGSALGVAVLGSLVTSRVIPPITTGFAAAATPAFVVIAVCGVVVLALGIVSTTDWAKETARRTAEHFAEPAPSALTAAKS